MAVPLYLKSGTFGQFEQLFVPQGADCPPGLQPQTVPCAVGPCPTLCVAGESDVLSGQPLAEMPEAPAEIPAEAGGEIPQAGFSGMTYLLLLGLLALLGGAAARRAR